MSTLYRNSTLQKKYSFLLVLIFLVGVLLPVFPVLGDVPSENIGEAVRMEGESEQYNCSFKGVATLDPETISGCFAMGSFYLVKKPAYFVAGQASLLFNFVLFKLVAGMGAMVDTMDGIYTAWQVLRDLANVLLVFLLVYVGIATILGISGYGYKQLLWKIVIAALFVNFSITFANIVIDVSNIAAVEAYTMFLDDANMGTSDACMSVEGNLTADDNLLETNNCVSNGIAGAFWTKLKVTTSLNLPKEGTGPALGTTDRNWLWFFANILGGIFLLVLAFMFAAAAFLLISRFVILIYLIIVSPFALVIWVTGVSSAGKKWWTTLLNQSIFAPALILMWWVAYKVLEPISLGENDGLADSASFGGAALSVTMTYAIGVGFLLAGLVIAKRLGAHGATTIMNTGSKWSKALAYGTAGAAGAYLIGKPAYHAAGWQREAAAQAHQKDADGRYMDNSLSARFLRSKAGAKIDRGVQATVAAPSKVKFMGTSSYAGRKESSEKAAKAQQKEFETINRKTELKSAIEMSTADTSRMNTEGKAQVAKARETLKKIQHADIKENADLFTKNPEKMAHVSHAVFKQTVENKDETFTAEEVRKFKEERSKHFMNLSSDEVADVIQKSKPSELADHDASFLGRAEVVGRTDKQTMAGMIKSGLTKEKRDAMKATVDAKYNEISSRLGGAETQSTILDPTGRPARQALDTSQLTAEEKNIVDLYKWFNDDSRMLV